MSTYEEQRLANIKRNQSLLDDLGIAQKELKKIGRKPPAARQKRQTFAAPSRTSARIAAAPAKPDYNDDEPTERSSKRRKTSSTTANAVPPEPSPPPRTPKYDLATVEQNWYDWTPAASPPTRSPSGTFHFESHPHFQPNKSPLEILREGAFGGSYYHPLRSRAMGMTVSDDYLHLPADWLAVLDAPTQLTRDVYEPEANKYGVKCGQSIEEWEAAGWINAEWDVRGWFQWYERFFRGRRGEDDDRQVGRWARCCGERGRWRRALCKAYLRKGVRDVADEGLDEDAEEVSPVLCQTCLHWAWEMRQEELDKVWAEGLG